MNRGVETKVKALCFVTYIASLNSPFFKTRILNSTEHKYLENKYYSIPISSILYTYMHANTHAHTHAKLFSKIVQKQQSQENEIPKLYS